MKHTMILSSLRVLSLSLGLLILLAKSAGVVLPGNISWLDEDGRGSTPLMPMSPRYEEYLPISYIILGEDGLPIIRVVVDKDSDCPNLALINGAIEEKGIFPLPHLKIRSVGNFDLPHAFPIKICEIRADSKRLRRALRRGILGISSPNKQNTTTMTTYPLPKVKHDPHTFLLIGDTGLRSKPKHFGSGEACKNKLSVVYGVNQCDFNLTRDDLEIDEIEGSFQEASTREWPFQLLSAEAASLSIDIIVHVGDYVYRQGPCPYPYNCSSINLPLNFDNSDLLENNVVMNFLPGMWGDNWFGWWGDFFWPALVLLKRAPMIAVRGNHEICSRAGYGYRLLLSHEDYPNDVVAGSVCEDYTRPFAVKFKREQFLVSDDSAIESREVDNFDFVQGACPSSLRVGAEHIIPEKLVLPDDVYLPQREIFAKNFNEIEVLSQGFDTNFYVGHHPILAVACNDTSMVMLDYTLQQSLGNSTLDRFASIISGHMHWLEVLEFRDNNLPAQIVVGNGGTKTIPNFVDQKILPKVKLEFGRKELGMTGFVQKGITSSTFGFGVMKRSDENDGYNVTFKEWNPAKLDVDDITFHLFIPSVPFNRLGTNCKMNSNENILPEE